STLMLIAAVDVIDRYSTASIRDHERGPMPQALNQIASIVEPRHHPIDTPFGITKQCPSDEGTTPAPAEIEEAISSFPAPMAVAASAPAPSDSDGFFAQDALTTPDYLRYALKTTAAAMTCYFFYTLLDWPGIHTCLITCYIVVPGQRPSLSRSSVCVFSVA